MKIGDNLPAITVNCTPDENLKLTQFKKKNIVIYFYPKDSTPGCTTEGQNFSELQQQFKSHDTLIFGVSRDSIKSHLKFKEKHQFSFELISDPDEVLCKAFDVIKLKKLYGREYLGIERSTFLFNKKGLLVNEWRKIRVKGHVELVLEAVKAL